VVADRIGKMVESQSIATVINCLLLPLLTATIVLGLGDVTGNDVMEVKFTSDSSAVRG